MIRLLLLALFFYLVYTLITFILRSFSAKPMQPPPEKTSLGEDMVRDPNCATYVPRGDAVKKGENYFARTSAGMNIKINNWKTEYRIRNTGEKDEIFYRYCRSK